jgi:hypothetical protein
VAVEAAYVSGWFGQAPARSSAERRSNFTKGKHTKQLHDYAQPLESGRHPAKTKKSGLHTALLSWHLMGELGSLRAAAFEFQHSARGGVVVALCKTSLSLKAWINLVR